MHRQIRELLTNYGEVGVMWFDGEWEGTYTHEQGAALFELCRQLQPNTIINNRVDKGRGGMAGMTTDSRFKGDFGTPEQEVPPTGFPGFDWETCMTMNGHWGYNKNDTRWKSTEDLVQMLVDIASKGGNLLLNVGPTSMGEFPAASVARLLAMGRWLDVHGESIYATTASPFEHLEWGRCTVRSDGRRTRFYLHVFDWPKNGLLVVPGIGNEPAGAHLLGTEGRPLAVERNGTNLEIKLPKGAPDPICSVVALDVLEREPIIYAPPKIKAPSSILVRDLEVCLEAQTGELAIHYTLDGANPARESPVYGAPFRIDQTTTVRARGFHKNKPVTEIVERTFTRVEPALARDLELFTPGLRCEVYEGTWDRVPQFDLLTPSLRRVVSSVRLEEGPAVEFVAWRFSGYLLVPQDEVYCFLLTSDDGSRLYLDDTLVIDNDALHGSLAREGIIALSEGKHLLRVEYFNKTGGADLEL